MFKAQKKSKSLFHLKGDNIFDLHTGIIKNKMEFFRKILGFFGTTNVHQDILFIYHCNIRIKVSCKYQYQSFISGVEYGIQYTLKGRLVLESFKMTT